MDIPGHTEEIMIEPGKVITTVETKVVHHEVVNHNDIQTAENISYG